MHGNAESTNGWISGMKKIGGKIGATNGSKNGSKKEERAMQWSKLAQSLHYPDLYNMRD